MTTKKKTAPEVEPAGDFAFKDATDVELSRVSASQVWIGIRLKDGRVIRFNLAARADGALTVSYDVQDK